MKAQTALALVALALLAPGWLQPAVATPLEDRSRAMQRASDAVVGLRVSAVKDARSNATLGAERRGSGVVVGSDGLVLTIGYLVLEADEVTVTTDDGRKVPARVVAYDVATGFGLVQALAPLRLEPVPLGRSGTLAIDEPLTVISGGEDGAISAARLVSQRLFSGYWEYHIDGALFTGPPRCDHSGAALYNASGELVGIGSLLVSDALGPRAPRQPGNMFVPVDLLTPVFGELRSRGMSQQSERAWLGLNCVESDGGVRVLRVSDDSPAEVAGLQAGDRIVRIDGAAVVALEMLWKTLWAGGLPEREITLDIVRDGQPKTLRLKSVDRMKTLKRAQGI